MTMPRSAPSQRKVRPPGRCRVHIFHQSGLLSPCHLYLDLVPLLRWYSVQPRDGVLLIGRVGSREFGWSRRKFWFLKWKGCRKLSARKHCLWFFKLQVVVIWNHMAMYNNSNKFLSMLALFILAPCLPQKSSYPTYTEKFPPISAKSYSVTLSSYS